MADNADKLTAPADDNLVAISPQPVATVSPPDDQKQADHAAESEQLREQQTHLDEMHTQTQLDQQPDKAHTHSNHIMSAGPRPTMDLKGEANPTQISSQETLNHNQVGEVLTQSQAAIQTDYGESQIYPTQPPVPVELNNTIAPPPVPIGLEELSAWSETATGWTDYAGQQVEGQQSQFETMADELAQEDEANHQADEQIEARLGGHDELADRLTALEEDDLQTTENRLEHEFETHEAKIEDLTQAEVQHQAEQVHLETEEKQHQVANQGLANVGDDDIAQALAQNGGGQVEAATIKQLEVGLTQAQTQTSGEANELNQQATQLDEQQQGLTEAHQELDKHGEDLTEYQAMLDEDERSLTEAQAEHQQDFSETAEVAQKVDTAVADIETAHQQHEAAVGQLEQTAAFVEGGGIEEDFSQVANPEIKTQVETAKSHYQAEQEAYQQDIEAGFAERETQLNDLLTEGQADLAAIQQDTQQQVAQAKETWFAKNEAIAHDYTHQSTTLKQEGEQTINQTVTTTTREVDQKLTEAEGKAQQLKQKAETQASSVMKEGHAKAGDKLGGVGLALDNSYEAKAVQSSGVIARREDAGGGGEDSDAAAAEEERRRQEEAARVAAQAAFKAAVAEAERLIVEMEAQAQATLVEARVAVDQLIANQELFIEVYVASVLNQQAELAETTSQQVTDAQNAGISGIMMIQDTGLNEANNQYNTSLADQTGLLSTPIPGATATPAPTPPVFVTSPNGTPVPLGYTPPLTGTPMPFATTMPFPLTPTAVAAPTAPGSVPHQSTGEFSEAVVQLLEATVPDMYIVGFSGQVGPFKGGGERVYDFSTNEIAYFSYDGGTIGTDTISAGIGPYIGLGWRGIVDDPLADAYKGDFATAGKSVGPPLDILSFGVDFSSSGTLLHPELEKIKTVTFGATVGIGVDPIPDDLLGFDIDGHVAQTDYVYLGGQSHMNDAEMIANIWLHEGGNPRIALALTALTLAKQESNPGKPRTDPWQLEYEPLQPEYTGPPPVRAPEASTPIPEVTVEGTPTPTTPEVTPTLTSTPTPPPVYTAPPSPTCTGFSSTTNNHPHPGSLRGGE